MATVPRPRPAIAESRSYLWGAFLVGFFLQFNLVPTAWHIPITRFSQLVMLPCIAFLVHRLLSRANPLSTLFYCVLMLLFVALHLALGGASLAFGNANIDLALSVGSALYLLGGVGLYILVAQRSGTTWFCWGILLGGLLSLIVFVMEANGMTGLAKAIGLAQATQNVQMVAVGGGIGRLTGMWGHANEVGHVLAIAAPAAGYLFVSKRERMPLVILGIILAVCFFYTANRGGIIAAMATCIAMLFARKESIAVQRNSILLTLGAMAVIAYALYFLPPPAFIYERFADDAAMTNNASGRMATTLAGIEIALRHPFGMQVQDWRSALLSQTGFQTPHNGFISMANGLGVPFLLMYLFALVVVVIAGLRQPRKLSLDIFLMLAAVQMSVSFLFEELSYVDAFMLMFSLVMARVYSGAVNLAERRPAVGRARRRTDAEARPVTS